MNFGELFRSFRSRWFKKPFEPSGKWATNGYFGSTNGTVAEMWAKLADNLEAQEFRPPVYFLDLATAKYLVSCGFDFRSAQITCDMETYEYLRQAGAL